MQNENDIFLLTLYAYIFSVKKRSVNFNNCHISKFIFYVHINWDHTFKISLECSPGETFNEIFDPFIRNTFKVSSSDRLSADSS